MFPAVCLGGFPMDTRLPLKHIDSVHVPNLNPCRALLHDGPIIGHEGLDVNYARTIQTAGSSWSWSSIYYIYYFLADLNLIFHFINGFKELLEVYLLDLPFH